MMRARSWEPFTDAFSPNRTHAFLKEGDTFTTIDAVGALSFTMAFGLSTAGQVAGIYNDARTGFGHGFLWNAARIFFTTIDIPGAFTTLAEGVNRAGHVVGIYEDYDAEGRVTPHSFITDGTTYTTITVPFATALGSEVRGINDAGQLVGEWGDGRTLRGFLATPNPACGAEEERTAIEHGGA